MKAALSLILASALTVAALLPVPVMAQSSQYGGGQANYLEFALTLEALNAAKGRVTVTFGGGTQSLEVSASPGIPVVASVMFPFSDGDWVVNFVTDNGTTVLHLTGDIKSDGQGYSAEYGKGSAVDLTVIDFPSDQSNLELTVGNVSGAMGTKVIMRQKISSAVITLGLDANGDNQISPDELHQFTVSGTQLIAETPVLSLPLTARYFVEVTQGSDNSSGQIARASGQYDFVKETAISFDGSSQVFDHTLATDFEIYMKRTTRIASIAMPNRDIVPGPITASPKDQPEDTTTLLMKSDYSGSAQGTASQSDMNNSTEATSSGGEILSFLNRWWLPIAVVAGILLAVIGTVWVVKGMLR